MDDGDLGADPIDAAGIVTLLGYPNSVDKLEKWRADPSFPQPITVLSVGPIWRTGDIVQWARSVGHLPELVDEHDRPRRRTYSLREAAEVLGVSYWTVRDAVADGRIPRVPHTGRRIVIPRRVIDAMAAGEPIPE